MEAKTGTIGTGKGAVVVNLEFGSDKPDFSAVTATKGHDEHHAKHAAEMGLNLRQWKQEAADLLNAEACENFYDWSIPAVEKFFRYDVTTSRLAVGDRNGNIKTYFILSKSARKQYLPKEYLAILEGRK